MYNFPRIIITFYLVHLSFCHGNDWQYSLSSIHELFDLELKNLAAIEKYIENENERLDAIRRFIESREESNAKELAESYTESSINAFKTILRVKTDWEIFKNEMTLTNKIELKSGSLTNDTVVSALKALRRFQIIYELEVNELTNGNINEYTFEKFDADDCYEMASWCYDNAEFHCAYHWFAEAYNKKKSEENSQSNIDFMTFIKKYVWSSYFVGDINKAAELINNDIVSQPNFVLTDELTNMRYIVWTGHEVYKRNTADDKDKKFYSHSLRKLDSNGEVRSYITACQDFYLSPYLTCRYYHGRDKFLTIAPLREETVTLIPNIKLYYNVLYDGEIQQIKELAKPKLERLSTDTDEDITLRKVATFSYRDDRVFDLVHNRLAQMSPTSKFEVLNKYVVTNYGLAGHYLPHNKYIDEDHKINSRGRQATVIFHMDDVPVGGDTVIPELSLRVPSVKGSALVVSTTKNIITPVGALFTKTQYGSCPIFYGDKWTLTAWLGDEN